MEMNVCRVVINESAERLDAASRWITLILKQTKKARYLFRQTGLQTAPLLVTKGPAKSILVTKNGGVGVSLPLGS